MDPILQNIRIKARVISLLRVGTYIACLMGQAGTRGYRPLRSTGRPTRHLSYSDFLDPQDPNSMTKLKNSAVLAGVNKSSTQRRAAASAELRTRAGSGNSLSASSSAFRLP